MLLCLRCLLKLLIALKQRLHDLLCDEEPLSQVFLRQIIKCPFQVVLVVYQFNIESFTVKRGVLLEEWALGLLESRPESISESLVLSAGLRIQMLFFLQQEIVLGVLELKESSLCRVKL